METFFAHPTKREIKMDENAMAVHTNGRTTWPAVEDRQRWLAVLANAKIDALTQAWTAVPDKPHYVFLRSPETGLAQIRGRAGGTGQQFNFGEVTLSRCTVLLESGEATPGSRSSTWRRLPNNWDLRSIAS
jgi:hypothetical protein